ncbi:ABC transporter, ATP-binding protein [Enterococcus faecalis 13-SD-W-01]|nr:ABC transporter, ATP-binding protein [Enterococcus faecalis 13-SD-W-01]
MIECIDVSKKFQQKEVLKEITLKIENKKITSLIGKNGAGKSTLIGAILEYYKIDSGEILKKDISVMPDAETLDNEVTGYAFLTFMCKLKKLNDNKQAIELAEELNLKKDLNKKIENYSFGMKKKISFIQACLGNYDTYIFDEPTSGVDEPSAMKMLEIVNRLKEIGGAVLLTSHNLDELERVSDYVYVIDKGRIIETGTVEAIVGRSSIGDYRYKLITDVPQLVVDTLSHLSNITMTIINGQQVEIEFQDNDKQFREVLKLLLDSNVQFTEFYKVKQSLRESIYAQDL